MVLLTEIENSLWGLVLQGKNEYVHKSERPVHVSMAALDTASTHDQYVPVMVQQDNHSYIVCTLHAPSCLQQSLELELNKGETVTFSLNSNGVVHLTGYYIQEEEPLDEEELQAQAMAQMGMLGHQDHSNCDHDDGELNGFDDDELGDSDEDDENDDDEDGEDDFDEEDEDDDEEEEDEEEDTKLNGKKRKLETNDKKTKKENKKSKKEEESEDEDDDEDDEEDFDDEDDIEDSDREEEEPPKLVKAKEEKKQDKKENKQQQQQKAQVKNVGGVQVLDVKAGNGPEAKKGKYVHVYYKGTLKQNGKQFDACQSGKPFKFRLGSGEVIKGWDIGVAGMKVGGKRTLTIPPSLAYGNQKLGGIPSNSTLVFEVELKAVS